MASVASSWCRRESWATPAGTTANFVNFTAGGEAEWEDLYNFDGDRMVRRHGAMFVLDAVEADVRAYGFYTDIGARGTGADITHEARLIADNDWVANYGVRASYTAGLVIRT